MEIISAERTLSGLFQTPIMTLGNFDGVHLGHQLLIRKVCDEAKNAGVKSIVYTFDPHPLHVLDPGRCPLKITSPRQKIRLISEMGVDYMLVARFTPIFAAQRAREFAENIIHRQISPKKIIIGKNFYFGRNREGDAALLADFGKTMGFEVEAVPRIKIEGTVVSSTLIRNLLLKGDVNEVSRYLGRFHMIQGLVVSGHSRGRALGYPTANIRPTDGICPAEGVYAVRVELENDIKSGVLSIGRNLTFGEEPLSIEAHIFGFDDNLYEKEIKVLFVKRLRDSLRFANEKDLIDQISKDIQNAKKILEEPD